MHRRTIRRSSAALLATLVLGTLSPATGGAGLLAATSDVTVEEVDLTPVAVIVQQWDGDDTGVAAAVRVLGGTVTRQLPVVLGFAATVPTGALGDIAALPGVRVVSPDHPVAPLSSGTSLAERPDVYREVVGSAAANAAGLTGKGATVAVVDTGIAAVAPLADRLVPVVDAAGVAQRCLNLSVEPGCQDSFGHGTFVAGMVNGVAPDARLLAIKLSGRDGFSNVSTVLAAIDWVIANRDVHDIDVLNLSLRTDSTLSYRLDPLNHAVQRAWARGVTVVVSAGNQGSASHTIAKPADDPWVISVAATDDAGTVDPADDTVAPFSSRGPTLADGLAKPDVAAPGKSVVSLRSPGSFADEEFPYFVDDARRRGSGTSFSAPIVAGAAALLLEADPAATNDRLKFALMQTARSTHAVTDVGAGVVDVPAALAAPAGEANVALFHPLLFPLAHPTDADLAGSAFDGLAAAWDTVEWEGRNWQGRNWQGRNWQGRNWQSLDYEGRNWQGRNWQTMDWEGRNWQGRNWQSERWS